MRTIKCLLFLVFLLQFLKVSSQDIIYRNDTKQPVIVNIISEQVSSRVYRLFNSNDTAIHHISITRIDSIIYQSGKKEIFATIKTESLPILSNTGKDVSAFTHHLAGIDAGAWFYKNIRFSYEYFPFNPNLGFKTSVSFRTTPFMKIEIYDYDYGDEELSYHYRNFRGYSVWHGTLGADYYFFKPGSFRVLTGLHYVHGTYIINYIITDGNYNVVGTRDERKPLNGMLLNVYLFYRVNEYLSVNIGLDKPLWMKPPMQRSVFTAEFLLNF